MLNLNSGKEDIGISDVNTDTNLWSEIKTAIEENPKVSQRELVVKLGVSFRKNQKKMPKVGKCGKIVRTSSNPGILKLPIEDIFRGGNSKPRNPHMQTMLRMVGFGDDAGSGFPAILATWEIEGWIEPEFVENTGLNQVTLVLKMIKAGNKMS